MTELVRFRRLVWRYYRVHGRHDLPWRRTHDLYKILVSEVMLQQTQVDRVVPFYMSFIKKFPTAKILAAAPLSDVLRAWQGLGYNRRAKMLHDAAAELVAVQISSYRTNPELLERLPGVGPYTARAVAAFAYNKDVVVVETNIRTVMIHHFFPEIKNVRDKNIEEVLQSVLPKGRAREWYSALMDYGAYLKRSGISHNGRVQGYVKQARFTGSLREARGVLLRELTAKPSSREDLLRVVFQRLGEERREQIGRALDNLCREGLAQRHGRYYRLAN